MEYYRSGGQRIRRKGYFALSTDATDMSVCHYWASAFLKKAAIASKASMVKLCSPGGW